MSSDQDRNIPAYASFASFKSFLSKLSEGDLPGRIDKSVILGQSNGTRSAILAALRSLRMINAAQQPEESFRRLVQASEADRPAALLAILQEGYPYIFSPPFDLGRATPQQLVDAFRDNGAVAGSTVEKAISFFLAASKEAGVKLSSHLEGRKQGTSTGRKKKRPAKLEPDAVVNGQGGAGNAGEQSGKADRADALIAKFPAFDPTWPDEIKAKWFDGFYSVWSSVEKDSKPK